MANCPESWPKGTGELLPNLLFKIAAQHPDLLYTEYSINPRNAKDGYRKVNYREFANAVHAVAWWIENNVGKPKTTDVTETLVYMGPNDVMFGILALGSTMVGYKTLFPRPRHSVEGTAVLIDSVGGKVLLTPSISFPFSSEVLERRLMATFQLPSIEDLLSSQLSPYPYTKTFEQHKHEGFVVLHTSGTTGFPKPITWTHEWPHSFAQGLYLPNPDGFDRIDNALYGVQSRLLMFFPTFHCSGFHGTLLFPLFTGAITVWPPSGLAPLDQFTNVVDAFDIIGGTFNGSCIAPPYVELLASNPVLLSRFAEKVKKLNFAAADISQAAGDIVSEKMPLFDMIGSTELGIWPALRKIGPWNAENLDENWHYMHFHPAMNIRFEHVSEDKDGGIFEAIMVRNEGDGAWVQPIFKIFSEETEISLHDLFTQHPQSPHHWKHYGRTDELLTFLTGEKWHPGGAEKKLGGHLSIAEAMMVGTRRTIAALIIRLAEGSNSNDLWSAIEEVNKGSPVYAQVERDMVLSVKEPFLKTAKGSV